MRKNYEKISKRKVSKVEFTKTHLKKSKIPFQVSLNTVLVILPLNFKQK